jgi:hypothetical protein
MTLPPRDIWDGGWNGPGEHSSRIDDVFCDDDTANAEHERREATRPAGFTSTRHPTVEAGVSER